MSCSPSAWAKTGNHFQGGGKFNSASRWQARLENNQLTAGKTESASRSQAGLKHQLEMYSVLNAYAGGGLDRLGQSHLVSLNNNLHTLREDDRNFLVIAIFPELGSRQFSNILTTRQCILWKKTNKKIFPPGSQNGISRPNCDRLQNLLTSNSVRLLQKLSYVPSSVGHLTQICGQLYSVQLNMWAGLQCVKMEWVQDH